MIIQKELTPEQKELLLSLGTVTKGEWKLPNKCRYFLKGDVLEVEVLV